MNSKAFVLLVVAILVLGGGLGGAFAGGVVVDKGQNEEAPVNSLPQTPSNQTQTPFDPSQLSQEELDQLREQFQGQRPGGGGTGGGGTGFGGIGGLTGTIDGIEGNVVTVSTSQGPLVATVGADTTVQMTVQGSLEDLEPGVQVTVIGQRGEDGTVQAVTIIILPEGGGLFGGGQFGGGQFGGG